VVVTSVGRMGDPFEKSYAKIFQVGSHGITYNRGMGLSPSSDLALNFTIFKFKYNSKNYMLRTITWAGW
jgi:hypothetical protein